MYTSADFNQGIDQLELSELIDIKFLQEYQDADFPGPQAEFP